MIQQGPLLVRLMNGLRCAKTAILGAYAEFARVSEDGFLARKPANMTMEEAAAVFVGAVCSLYFLRKARIQPVARVLVHVVNDGSKRGRISRNLR
jgi:NADPH:quinone reductase-like Zn-dependent oxidoreductase